jgi:predicted TIM-barrel fold metal-dependent hydrolase
MSPSPSGRPTGVTDIHVHIQPWSTLKPGVDEMLRKSRQKLDLDDITRFQDDPGALTAEMDRLGIRRLGLINYTSRIMGFGEEVNDWIVGYAEGRGDRLLPFGCPDLRGTRDIPARMEDLREKGLWGLKIHPPHMELAPNAYLQDPGHPVREVYATAQRLGMPLMIHTGTSAFPGARSRLGDPMLVDDVAVDFPELRIIMAHGGRPLWPEESFFLARRHRNVYIDLSGIPARRIPQLFPRLDAISGKVLYGSDWPGPGVPSLETCLDGFWSLDLSPDLKRRILVDNFEVFAGQA